MVYCVFRFKFNFNYAGICTLVPVSTEARKGVRVPGSGGTSSREPLEVGAGV